MNGAGDGATCRAFIAAPACGSYGSRGEGAACGALAVVASASGLFELRGGRAGCGALTVAASGSDSYELRRGRATCGASAVAAPRSGSYESRGGGRAACGALAIVAPGSRSYGLRGGRAAGGASAVAAPGSGSYGLRGGRAACGAFRLSRLLAPARTNRAGDERLAAPWPSRRPNLALRRQRRGEVVTACLFAEDRPFSSRRRALRSASCQPSPGRSVGGG